LSKQTKYHDVDCRIFGNDMQIVRAELDPNKTVLAEAGAVNYFDNNISLEKKLAMAPNLLAAYSIPCCMSVKEC